MKDYRGTPLTEGDTVSIYWGHNELKTGVIKKIQGNRAKVEITYTSRRLVGKGLPYEVTTEKVLSKWKSGECMVKLEGTT